MVKKLYRHEFIAWLRIIVFVWGAAVLTAGINRVIQLFETDSIYYNILFFSSLIAFAVAMLCCAATPTIFGIVRFYRNFFTGEGYLTFTLPATKGQLLWVKVSTAVCFSMVSLLVCLFSGWIIMAGDVFTELCKATAYLFKDISGTEMVHLIGWLLEFALLLLVADLGSHLFYYTCICLGQTFRKNRILAAIGVYFAFYIITQVLSTIGSVVLVIQSELGLLDWLGEFIVEHPETFIHIALLTGVVLSAAMAGLYWLICRWVLHRRLNLE